MVNARTFTTFNMGGQGVMAQKLRDLDPYSDPLHFLGAELRVWRTHRELSQQRLADQVPCHRSLLSLAEAGRQLLTEEVLARCDAILETGGALARLRRWAEIERTRVPEPPFHASNNPFRPAERGPDGHPSAPETEVDVKRRHLLRAIGVGTALSPAALEVVSQARASAEDRLATGGRSAALVDHWETTAHRYGYGYQGRSAPEVLRDALLDLNDAHHTLSSVGSSEGRKRLWRVCAQLAGVAAIVLHDLGHDRDAHRWFGTAGAFAAENGDRHLRAWLLAREAMVPLNYGRPAGAVALAAGAREAAGAAPSAPAALAAAVQARAFASLGRADEARTAMRDAERARNALRGHEATDTWYGYPDQKHSVHASRAYTLSGDVRAAREAQREALRLSGPSSVMSPALIRLDESACLSHDGDHDAACGSALSVLTRLAPHQRGGLITERAREVVTTLPEAARELPAARELREVLSGVSQPGAAPAGG